MLALSRGGIVICNGYKDREYIRLALIGRKLGLDVFIVIESPAELDIALEEAAALGVAPLLGARLRLASLAVILAVHFDVPVIRPLPGQAPPTGAGKR